MRMQMRSCSVVLVTAVMILGSTLANAKSKYVCDEPTTGGQLQHRQHMRIRIHTVYHQHPEIRGWRKRQAEHSGCEGQSVLLYKSRHYGRVDDLE